MVSTRLIKVPLIIIIKSLLGLIPFFYALDTKGQTLTFEKALEVGKQSGQDVNSNVSIQDTDLDETVPGNQGANTPETQYYDNPAAVEGAASQAAANNEAAQSVREGHFNRPSFSINPETDPLIQRSNGIQNDPESIAGSIEGEYSECTTGSQTIPGETVTEVCHSFSERIDQVCHRTLDVQCDLVEYEVTHRFPATYTLVSADTSGQNEHCHIDFTESKMGLQRVINNFNEDCTWCDLVNNPLGFAEFGFPQCSATWEYHLKHTLRDAYLPIGEIVSITFNDGVSPVNGSAIIQVLEQVNYCNWLDDWNHTECTTYETPSCARLEDTCIDGPATRIIEGHEAYRECWQYETSYRCLTDEVGEEPYCNELRERGCTQVDSQCVAPLENHCSEYEQSFECPAGEGYEETVVDCSGQLYCLNGNCFDSSYPPNEGVALAATHLATLEEMSNDFDPENLRIFTGEALECSKAVLGFKNCCKDSGWGVDLELQQCDEEEQQLGYAREAGRCHKVGDYCAKKDFFGVCTSRHYAYCCFSGKLARIIQQQGRTQLGIGWGTAKAPDCRGFTPEELQRIDFSQIDFSEFYADALNNLTPLDQQQLQKEIEQSMQERNGVSG